MLVTTLTKGKEIQAESRTGYRCSYRIRRFDTRLGTVYLSVPKIRQGDYIPFFVTEKKRSEQALIQVVQGCWLTDNDFLGQNRLRIIVILNNYTSNVEKK